MIESSRFSELCAIEQFPWKLLSRIDGARWNVSEGAIFRSVSAKPTPKTDKKKKTDKGIVVNQKVSADGELVMLSAGSRYSISAYRNEIAIGNAVICRYDALARCLAAPCSSIFDYRDGGDGGDGDAPICRRSPQSRGCCAAARARRQGTADSPNRKCNALMRV